MERHGQLVSDGEIHGTIHIIILITHIIHGIHLMAHATILIIIRIGVDITEAATVAEVIMVMDTTMEAILIMDHMVLQAAIPQQTVVDVVINLPARRV